MSITPLNINVPPPPASAGPTGAPSAPRAPSPTTTPPPVAPAMGGGTTPPPTGTAGGGNPSVSPINGLTQNFERNRHILVLLSLIINTGILIWAWYMFSSELSIDKNNEWNWGAVVWSLQLLHFIASIKIIKPDELAAAMFLGKPIYSVTSGPRYIPFILCWLIRIDRKTQQKQFPGEPEEIDKSGNDEKPLDGKVQPMRITTASRDTVDPSLVSGTIKTILQAKDPLNDRLTTEVTAIVRWRIRGIDGLIQFIVNIGSIKEANRQMRDVIERVLRTEFGKRTPSLIIMQRVMIDACLKLEVKELVRDTPASVASESWGIDILDVQVMDTDWSKTVNIGLAKTVEQSTINQRTVSGAQAKAEALRATGSARRDYLIAEGAGRAQAQEDMLVAQAVGAKEMILKVGNSETGMALMKMQIFRDALEKANYSIVPGDLNGIVAGLQETLTKTKPKGATP